MNVIGGSFRLAFQTVHEELPRVQFMSHDLQNGRLSGVRRDHKGEECRQISRGDGQFCLLLTGRGDVGVL